MTFEDLEKRVIEVNATPYKEICVWYKVVNNPNSTTRQDIHNMHSLYNCYANCTGRPNGKTCYRTIDDQNKFAAANKINDQIEQKKDKMYVRFILGDMTADPNYN